MHPPRFAFAFALLATTGCHLLLSDPSEVDGGPDAGHGSSSGGTSSGGTSSGGTSSGGTSSGGTSSGGTSSGGTSSGGTSSGGEWTMTSVDTNIEVLQLADSGGWGPALGAIVVQPASAVQGSEAEPQRCALNVSPSGGVTVGACVDVSSTHRPSWVSPTHIAQVLDIVPASDGMGREHYTASFSYASPAAASTTTLALTLPSDNGGALDPAAQSARMLSYGSGGVTALWAGGQLYTGPSGGSYASLTPFATNDPSGWHTVLARTTPADTQTQIWAASAHQAVRLKFDAVDNVQIEPFAFSSSVEQLVQACATHPKARSLLWCTAPASGSLVRVHDGSHHGSVLVTSLAASSLGSGIPTLAVLPGALVWLESTQTESTVFVCADTAQDCAQDSPRTRLGAVPTGCVGASEYQHATIGDDTVVFGCRHSADSTERFKLFAVQRRH